MTYNPQPGECGRCAHFSIKGDLGDGAALVRRRGGGRLRRADAVLFGVEANRQFDDGGLRDALGFGGCVEECVSIIGQAQRHDVGLGLRHRRIIPDLNGKWQDVAEPATIGEMQTSEQVAEKAA